MGLFDTLFVTMGAANAANMTVKDFLAPSKWRGKLGYSFQTKSLSSSLIDYLVDTDGEDIYIYATSRYGISDPEVIPMTTSGNMYGDAGHFKFVIVDGKMTISPDETLGCYDFPWTLISSLDLSKKDMDFEARLQIARDETSDYCRILYPEQFAATAKASLFGLYFVDDFLFEKEGRRSINPEVNEVLMKMKAATES